MSLDRFFVQPDRWRDELAVLAAEEGRHCVRVMRKRAGEEVEVFDGTGRWGRGTIVHAGDGEVQVAISAGGSAAPSLPHITLAVGIPKGKTMELVVQKAVELGVAAIQPLVTRNTVVQVDGAEVARKQEKWQRVALEACKQCGQNLLPVVAAPASFASWLEARREGRCALMGSLAEGARTFRDGIAGLPLGLRELDLLIGPEGDFTAEETAAARAAGFVPVTLGEITLRVETAVLYCLSVLNYELRGG